MSAIKNIFTSFKKRSFAVATIYFGAILWSPAQTYNTVDLSAEANFTWAGEVSVPGDITGVYMPGAPVGNVALGGIPFNIASNSTGFQAWSALVAANGDGGQVSVTIPVGVHGVTDVYTLVNSMWGVPGPTSVASLVFTGSGGASYSYPLIGNTNVRNWVPGGDGPTYMITPPTTNVYSGPAYWGGYTAVLDMQHIVLPAVFANQTLSTIQLIDSGNTGVQRTAIDGVTVVSIAGPPILSVQKALYLSSTNLLVGSNYQIQASSDLVNWTNQGSVFTATNSTWQSPSFWNVSSWNQLFFRIELAP